MRDKRSMSQYIYIYIYICGDITGCGLRKGAAG